MGDKTEMVKLVLRKGGKECSIERKREAKYKGGNKRDDKKKTTKKKH